MASTFSSLFIHIFVLYLSCSGLSSRKLIHNIVVLCSGEEAFYNKTWSMQDTEIMFNFTYLNGKDDSLSLYKTVATLYDFIDKYGVSLIISDNRRFSYGSIDILAGDLGIPVIKWFNDGLNPLPQEKNTVLYLEPNPSSQLTVITQLLQHYKWKRVAIVSDNDDGNLEMASYIRATVEKNGYSELLVNFTITPGGDSLTILKIMRDIQFSVVVLLSQPVLTSTFINKAKLLGLIKLNNTWILGVMQTTDVVGHNDFSLELPSEVIQLKFTGRRNTFLSFDYFMEDSIAIFRKTLKYPETFNGNIQSSINYVCPDDDVDKNLSKPMRSVLIDGHTGKIQFDSNGYRTNLKYDIVYWMPENETTYRESIVLGQYVRGTLNIVHGGWPPRVVKKENIPSKVFRVSVKEQKPYVIVSKNAEKENGYHCIKGLMCLGRDGKNYCCFGYCIEVLKMLIDDIGFEVRLHVVKDGKYGSKNGTTGQWSGLIGELVRGDTDIALADLTVSQERLRVVDFTQSFLTTGIGVLVKVDRDHNAHIFTGLSEPFTARLWIAIIILIHVVLLCMWTLERLSPYGLRERGKLNKDLKYTFSLEETMWYTWSLIFSSFEFDVRPKSTATRGVIVCFAFCLLILATSYTANLAVFLVVEHEIYPLNDAGIKDPKLQNPTADFAVGTIKGTIPESFFKMSKDPLYSRIWKHMKLHGVNSYSEGIDQLLSEKLNAFVFDYVTIMHEANTRRKCDLTVIGRPFVESSLSIALTKDSPLTSYISQRLFYYREYSIEKNIRNNWFNGHCQRSQESKISQASIVIMSGLFLVVVIGIVVAIVNLFLRHCFYQFLNWKETILLAENSA